MRASDEVVDFLARQIPAEQLASFRASEPTRQRVWQLVEKEKQHGLTPEECCELDDYERLEHLLILAKARADLQTPHA
jgi:hypothetical protein